MAAISDRCIVIGNSEIIKDFPTATEQLADGGGSDVPELPDEEGDYLLTAEMGEDSKLVYSWKPITQA